MFDLTDPIFQDSEKAREFLEFTRWPDGPYCPHCGETENVHLIEGKRKSHRPGTHQCNSCRGQFTVTVGTVFERSKVPLHKWLLATYLLSASKKGMSAHQIHRTLGVTYKTAWFMCHRIREAMREGELSPMGGPGSNVEVDETYIGKKRDRRVTVDRDGKPRLEGGHGHKNTILTLVDREGKTARSFHIAGATAEEIRPIVFTNVSRDSRLQTDEAMQYRTIGRQFKGGHGHVNHSAGEYVKGHDYTNTIEGYFSIFKRGMKGVYQHCGEQHLHRYLAEFDFRYNRRDMTDSERASEALQAIAGKRLTYRRTSQRANF